MSKGSKVEQDETAVEATGQDLWRVVRETKVRNLKQKDSNGDFIRDENGDIVTKPKTEIIHHIMWGNENMKRLNERFDNLAISCANTEDDIFGPDVVRNKAMGEFLDKTCTNIRKKLDPENKRVWSKPNTRYKTTRKKIEELESVPMDRDGLKAILS